MESGKGGTYFGATGCGKSFTMLYLTRFADERAWEFASPDLLVLIKTAPIWIDQLSGQFTNANGIIGDNV